MLNRRSAIASAAFAALVLPASAATLEGDGIVEAKSGYGFKETIAKLKADAVNAHLGRRPDLWPRSPDRGLAVIDGSSERGDLSTPAI